MKRRIPFLCACLMLAVAAPAAVVQRPSFSGTWELDQSKSHSIPPDMKQTMTVRQDGEKVSVEVKITDARGERTQTDSYALDGKEAEFMPPAPPNAPAGAPPPAKGKRKASWLPSGKGFVVEEEIPTQTPGGPFTLVVARKWTMWPDGTLSIEVIQETPRGTFNNKRVFVKKA